MSSLRSFSNSSDKYYQAEGEMEQTEGRDNIVQVNQPAGAISLQGLDSILEIIKMHQIDAKNMR